NLGGKLKPLFNQKVMAATGTLRFEVVGSSLQLFLNSSLVAFANDSTIAGPGSAGIYATSLTAVDNFSAAAAPARVNATLPFGDDFNTSDNGDQLNLHWTDQAGNFTLQGQAAVGKGKLNLATLNGVSAADAAVQALVDVSQIGASAGLVARYS